MKKAFIAIVAGLLATSTQAAQINWGATGQIKYSNVNVGNAGSTLQLVALYTITEDWSTYAIKVANGTVRKGDNLYAIAKTFGVSVADLKEWNRLDDKAQIFPGDKLAVAKPGSAKKPEAAKKAEPKKTEARPSEPKKAEPKASGSKKSEVWYTVRAGDNLWDISRRNNTTVDQLLKWNEKAKDGIRPGDRLKVGER